MMRKIIVNYVNPADAKEPAVADATNTLAFQLGEIESQLLDWLAWGEGPHPYPRIWPDRDSLGSWAEAISSAAAALRERDALAAELETTRAVARANMERFDRSLRQMSAQLAAYKAMAGEMAQITAYAMKREAGINP